MDLKCPYCGSGIEIVDYSIYGTIEWRISCPNRYCGAEWSAYGDMITEGRKQDA